MGWKKQKATCLLNIHSIQLTHSDPDPFQIEWKRGKTKGITQKVLQTLGNDLIFDKSINFECTIYIDAESHKIRSKKLLITLVVYRNETKN